MFNLCIQKFMFNKLVLRDAVHYAVFYLRIQSQASVCRINVCKKPLACLLFTVDYCQPMIGKNERRLRFTREQNPSLATNFNPVLISIVYQIVNHV